MAYGYPIVIGCDVVNPPKRIKYLATVFKAKLYMPVRVISEKEKTILAKNYKYTSSHERDALASGLKAYRKYENILRKLDAQKVNEEIIRQVFKGHSLAKLRKAAKT